uniref:Uncharacterized protein n=1 Tax=Dunaliella tertiolecta TaxID=3047 RepID=A0A7S3QSM1_DUNTE
MQPPVQPHLFQQQQQQQQQQQFMPRMPGFPPQQQQLHMNGGNPGFTQGPRYQPPSSYPSMPTPVLAPPPPPPARQPPPPAPLPTVPQAQPELQTQAEPSPSAQPQAEFDDSEEERLALITAAFAVWPPAQGPDTAVKLAVALAILTPPPQVSHQHGLVRHTASRRFTSKAACFARTKLPGEHFEKEHMVAGPSTLMHSQVQALLSSDPFYILESSNMSGTLSRDNDVRLDSALLAAAACKLADSSSSSNGADADGVPSTSTMYPPLEWPLTNASVSLLPSDALHFQAQPLTYRLMAAMANGPQASDPLLQRCLAVLRTRAKGVTPDRAHNALASAVSLATGEMPRLPMRWRFHLKVTADKANAALLSSPPPTGRQPPSAANAASAAAGIGSGSAAVAGGSNGKGGTVSEDVIKAQAVLKSDADGAALVAACLCAWPYPACAPTTFSKLALALAIITQPPGVIIMNKGRHRGGLDFVLKIIHRTLSHAPAHQGGRDKAVAAASGPRGLEAVLDSGYPLLEQQVDQGGMPMVVLQLPRLAAIACAAAGSTAEGSTAGRVPWPPAVEGLNRHLTLLHQQSQPLMEAFLTVMAAGGLPRAQLLRACLKRLRAMAESVTHEDAQELQKIAAAAASPVPNTAFAPPGSNPLGGPRNAVLLPPEPVKRQYISRKPEPKQSDPKEELQRQRAIAAALKAEIKGNPSQVPTAAAAPNPSPPAWSLARPPTTKPASQHTIPSSAASSSASSYPAAPSSWQQQQPQQPQLSPPFAVPEPVEEFKPVTNVDAYNALIAQYNAECGDSDDEDAKTSQHGKDQDSLDVDQDVIFFIGEDGVTQFALYASGKIDQK